MILNLLLCQLFFATGIQGQLLSAFIDEGSSRPVVLPLLLGRSGELGRLLIQTPLTRASSFLDLLSRTVWEINNASMSQLRRPPLTRLRKMGRETKGVLAAYRKDKKSGDLAACRKSKSIYEADARLHNDFTTTTLSSLGAPIGESRQNSKRGMWKLKSQLKH